MFCEIILSQRFPKHLGIFDYKIPNALVSKIKVGQLVTIPFRKSEYEGVVIKIKEAGISGKEIKEIIKINNPEPILTKQQITLAEWLSDYYLVSIGTVIKMMLPPVPRKKSSRGKNIEFLSLKKLTASREINGLVGRLFSDLQDEFLFWPEDEEQKALFVRAVFKKAKSQVLVIVPEISDVKFYLSQLPPDRLKKTAVIHGQLNKNQFYNAWQEIIKNKARIIIGTKLAIAAPLRRPQLVIVDREEDRNHKQSDQNPRFDSRLAAGEIAHQHGAKLLSISLAPSLEAYRRIQREKTVCLRTKPSEKKFPPIIVDMREERKKGNYGAFSDRLAEAAAATLAGGKKVFLFINKRGGASSVVCKDCGHAFSCAECGLPLAYHQQSRLLYCHRCNKKSDLPPFCPRCSGADFRFSGLGTQKTEEEAAKLWAKEKIIRLDTDTQIKKIGSASIIIGTEFALPMIDWEKIGLVGVVSADTLLHLPDFRAAERTWQLLRRLCRDRRTINIIQTYAPGQTVMKYFAGGEADKFYQTELADRRSLNYPPYSGLVRLVYRHPDKKTCLAEAERLYRLMRSSPLETSLLTPFSPFDGGRWQMYVILKYQPACHDGLLKKLISQVPDSWIIDRDPASLL